VGDAREEDRIHAAGIRHEARAERAQRRAQLLQFVRGVAHTLKLPRAPDIVERAGLGFGRSRRGFERFFLRFLELGVEDFHGGILLKFVDVGGN